MIKRRRRSAGQALAILAISVAVVLAATATVIDGGNAFQDRQQAQNAADSAALASAYARIQGGSMVHSANGGAAANGIKNYCVENII